MKIFGIATFYTHFTDLQTTFALKLLSKLEIESDKFSAQSSMHLLWMVSAKNILLFDEDKILSNLCIQIRESYFSCQRGTFISRICRNAGKSLKIAVAIFFDCGF